MIKSRIKLKILVSTSLCVLFFSLFSNLFLYNYLGKIISDKSERLKHQYIKTIQSQIELCFIEISKLGLTCGNDYEIKRAMNYHDLSTMKSRVQCSKAQDKLNNYLLGSPVSKYINHLIIFNMNSININARTLYSGTANDRSYLQSSPLVEKVRDNKLSQSFEIASSLSNNYAPSLTFICPIEATHNSDPIGYVYIELNKNLILDQIKPSEQFNTIFVASKDGRISPAMSGANIPELGRLLKGPSQGEIVTQDKETYTIDIVPLSQYDLAIYNYTNRTPFTGESLNMLYILVIILLTTACVGIIVALILSNSITKPIKILTKHIKKISANNDFSYDPEIEAPTNEIGEIGRLINYMTENISHLLKQKEQMFEHRKNIEISLLQSQVNPHFLYNTLDSIRWMAVIQKSDNIAQITLALENLLKNVTKGVGNRITIEEELSLLQDYLHIQTIRYVEAFTYECAIPEELLHYKIIKFTLQPLIENAIIHGIIPTGHLGRIKTNAVLDHECILITVEDDGAGMDEKTLSNLMTAQRNENKDSLSGIGIKNVDMRLNLVYGEQYGLSIDSQLGKFTRVIVRIPQEV